MSDIYHIQCANDADARAKLAEVRQSMATEMAYVSPSFHPTLPAYVVVLVATGSYQLRLGELGAVKVSGDTTEADEETPDDESGPQSW